MKRTLTIILLLLAVSLRGFADVTIDYCVQRALENYPELKKYGLLDNSTDLSLEEINRGWWPRLGLSAQANVQNIVPAFPDVLRNMLAQNGFELKGMGKFQYKVAAELNQTLWDGGVSRSQRAIERASRAASQAELNVELYAIRGRVEDIYFAILLIQEQIKQSESTINLLSTNLQRIQSMVRNGIAMQSDADIVEAQCLTMKQTLAEAGSALKGYREMLSIYMGEDIGERSLTCPEAQEPAQMESDRPELRLFDRRMPPMPKQSMRP